MLPSDLLTPDSTSPSKSSDTLSITNLRLDNPVKAPYVFADLKIQPATISLSLRLDAGVASAAGQDRLDQNTVHYGNLAKEVRKWGPSGSGSPGGKDGDGDGDGVGSLVRWAEGSVERLGRREDGSSRVAEGRVGVRLPKASAAGEAVEVVSESSQGMGARWVGVRFEGVRVMVLIGVNAVERTARQVLVVDLEVWARGTVDEVLGGDGGVAAFGLEREMSEIIEPTTFETLESLGEHILTHLQPKIRKAMPTSYAVKLTMKKPKAIAFADAPGLTLVRRLGDERASAGSSETAGREDGRKLKLIKPYV